jgi:hypothetical protein
MIEVRAFESQQWLGEISRTATMRVRKDSSQQPCRVR